MSLGGLKRLLGDGWSANCTYPPILTTNILRALRWVTIAVGNDGAGVFNVILDAGNDHVFVRDVIRNSRSGFICV